jgi:hypothetical protein
MSSNALRFALLTCLFGLVVLAVFLSHQGRSGTLIWSTYSESAHEDVGYLALLQNTNGTSSVYIAVDVPLEQTQVKLHEEWVLLPIDESVQWNPRVCAKTPSVILPGGDMYMYDTRRTSSGAFESFLVWYNAKSHTLSESRMGWGEFTGKTMFQTAGYPYFITKNDDRLYMSSYDTKVHVLTHAFLSKLGGNDSVTVTQSENATPLIERYDAKTLESELSVISDGKLIFDRGARIAQTVSYPDDSHSMSDLGNNFKAVYNLSNPYETSIMHGDTIVAEFLPEEKIYTYVIGSFETP